MPYYYYTQRKIKNPPGPVQQDEFDIYRGTLRDSTAAPVTHPSLDDEKAPPHIYRVNSRGPAEKSEPERLDYTVLPWDALTEVVKVMQYREGNNPRGSWQHDPTAYENYEAEGMRHRVARLRGEKTDPDTGLSHLAHEAACLLYQLWFRTSGKR